MLTPKNATERQKQVWPFKITQGAEVYRWRGKWHCEVCEKNWQEINWQTRDVFAQRICPTCGDTSQCQVYERWWDA